MLVELGFFYTFFPVKMKRVGIFYIYKIEYKGRFYV